MILCTDVDYKDDGTAVAAGVLLESWTARRAFSEHVVNVANVEPYVPGEFYRRELPCIQAVMDDITAVDVDLVVVDGYVWLDPGHKGLGAHLWDALGGKVPVVGVAKAYFKDAQALEVCRGKSKRPLYVTAEGMGIDEAAEHVAEMHGCNRFPDMLLRVDHLCRGRVAPTRHA